MGSSTADGNDALVGHEETFEEVVQFFEGNRNGSTAHISPAPMTGPAVIQQTSRIVRSLAVWPQRAAYMPASFEYTRNNSWITE